MNTHINEDELKLLAYLHDTVEGYGNNFQLKPDKVASDLSVDKDQLRKSASFLESFGLVGMVKVDVSTFAASAFLFTGIWLTGQGENYIRAVRSRAGVGRKLTVTTVKELWGMGKGALVSTAVQLLSEFAKHRF